MRSHLTRNVFRRLISSEAPLFRCPHQLEILVQRQYGGPLAGRQSARRTIFGFSAKPPRQIRSLDLDPGLSKMVDLSLMENVRARPPSATDLAKAFNTFFADKLRTKEAVNNVQARHALRTFRHLRDTNTEEGFGLTLSDLYVARDSLMKMPADRVTAHNEFARELFEEISRRKDNSGLLKGRNNIGDLKQYIMVLTLTGDSLEARRLVEELWNLSPSQNSETRDKASLKLWNLVLKGFALEKNEKELVNTAKLAEACGVPYSPSFHETMTTFNACQNNKEGTKAYYTKRIDKNHRPNARTVAEVLKFSLRNDEVEWCNSVFRALLDSNPNKLTWDVIFQWAATALGKGVEDLEHMMGVMARRNPHDESIRPDAETINGLVESAISRNDPYLAERYLALGLKLGILPNARTFILQMNYRVDARDLSGAQVAYDALRSEEIVDQEDLPVINKFIRALCSAGSPNYDRITSLVADLEERRARPEANTVSALCFLHLRHDEVSEVIDTLQAHSFHYTSSERGRIRDAFFSYCLDRQNITSRVWDAYTILRHMFDETDTESRVKLMNEFFDRRQSEMACHVFGHMRQHIRHDKRPTADTYVECFEGIARCSDMESLDMVHNMMKMDSSIEPSTRLLNALMIAYTACGEPYRALDFWSDITNSIEGPTYKSIQIVFRACEAKPFGDEQAKDIWNTMRRMEIEVTPEVFSAYIGALAGQALMEEAKALIEGMEADLGFGPDMMTLGTFYNATPGQNRRDIIDEWASERYPEVWEQLAQCGQTTTEEGFRLFNIDRGVRA